MSYLLKKSEILHDPAASFWLKKALQELDRRDPVDAWVDAKMLADLMEKKMKEAAK